MSRHLEPLRRTKPEPKSSVVFHAEVPIFLSSIPPGDHEHGEALLGKVFYKRVLRRQIENMVLHDPGRHDKDRLRPDLRGCWRILDELDQTIARNMTLPRVTATGGPP